MRESALLDAIRLLKSSYGSYRQNEWQQWLGEFQIRLKEQADLIPLFRDRTRPVSIAATIELAEADRAYLTQNATHLVRKLLRRRRAEDGALNDLLVGPGDDLDGSLVKQVEATATEVQRLAGDTRTHLASFEISTDLEASVAQNPLLSVLFSTYEPEDLGVVDYHGPHRHYGRERINSINLNVHDEASEKRGQHALYNSSNKYSSIKSEMAAAYVRELVAREAGTDPGESADLVTTLKELFKQFFPGKTFLGPKPSRSGGLDFPVSLADGSTHDINELSSGEKEVLFGYLRLRNSTPRHSVILLDEPELHLNPRLVAGLPRFYHQHIGTVRGNQLWCVTHSDAFLRESMSGGSEFSVYHVQPVGEGGDDQAGDSIGCGGRLRAGGRCANRRSCDAPASLDGRDLRRRGLRVRRSHDDNSLPGFRGEDEHLVRW